MLRFAKIRNDVPLLLVIAASALSWLILFIAVPAQNFPFADDWSYSKGAFTFAEGGGIHYYNWASMPLLGQWLWAVPFIKLFGPSLAVLHLSTIVLSWCGIIAFYKLLQTETGCSQNLAAFGAATLVFSPIFFYLTNSFMSDIPALSFSLIAIFFYSKAFSSDDKRWLLVATAFALLAGITRQNTICVPLAAGIILLQNKKWRYNLWAVGSVLLTAAITIATHFWLNARPDLGIYRRMEMPQPDQFFFLAFYTLQLCGAGVLPMLALFRRHFQIKWAMLSLLSTLLSIIPVLLIYEAYHHIGINMELVNCLRSSQSGCVSLYLLKRLLVVSIGALLGGMLLAMLLPHLLARKIQLNSVLGWFTLGQFLLLTTVSVIYLFERYFLVLMPGIIAVLLGRQFDRPAWKSGLAVLGILMLFNIILMHDRLSGHSALWRLGQRALVRDGISTANLVGGPEWDCWHSPCHESSPTPRCNYENMDACEYELSPRDTVAFILSSNRLPPEQAAAKVLDSEPYARWLIPGEGKVFLLQRLRKPEP